MATNDLDNKKTAARNWFEQLQGDIITRFEALEADAPTSLYPQDTGKFEKTAWKRGDGSEDLGGGTMAIMKGRLFEKVGVHTSTVYGEFSDEFRSQIPGAEESDGRFWASGISLIAHLTNPRVPAVHMNTRMIATSKTWFGGGADLTPLLDFQRHQHFEDSLDFHAALKIACDNHDKEYYPKFKKWCDEYFHLAHRDEPRGIGGIFYDRHDSGDWNADLVFTHDVWINVGESLSDILCEDEVRIPIPAVLAASSTTVMTA
ncbi:MAG: coproporphyrinogen III oxidase, partial [Pseudomonadota bacterium]